MFRYCYYYVFSIILFPFFSVCDFHLVFRQTDECGPRKEPDKPREVFKESLALIGFDCFLFSHFSSLVCQSLRDFHRHFHVVHFFPFFTSLFRIECMSIGHKFQPPIYRSHCRVRGGSV